MENTSFAVACVFATNLVLLIIKYVREQLELPARVFNRHGYKFQTGRFPDFIFDETVCLSQHVEAPLDRNPLVIDCGAHYGSFALHMAAQYNAEVHSFEPITELANLAKANAELNGFGDKIHVVNAAIGQRTALTKMECYPSFAFASGFVKLSYPISKRMIFLINGLLHASDSLLCVPKPSHFTLYNLILNDFKWMQILFYLVYGIAWFLLLWPSVLIVYFTEPQIVQYATPVITVGEYMRSVLDNREVDLLKIDIEGYGLEAISGVGETDWKRIKRVCIECEEHVNQEKMVLYLEERGFSVEVKSDVADDQIYAHKHK